MVANRTLTNAAREATPRTRSVCPPVRVASDCRGPPTSGAPGAALAPHSANVRERVLSYVPGNRTTEELRRVRGAEPLERWPWLRYDRIARAVTERLQVRPVSGEPFWVLAVRNPVHHTHYQVCLPELPDQGEAQFCSCADFARRGIGTCKHVEAALAWLETHPERERPTATARGSEAVWRAVDAAGLAAEGSSRPLAIRWRLPGAVLLERGSGKSRPVRKKEGKGKGSAEPRPRSPS